MVKKPLFIFSALCFWIGTVSQAQNSADDGKTDSRPNIVLIMADDMGYSDIGCYGGEIDTPNIDQLASEGMRFTHFYNASVCCPTRASLLTGRYPHQAGVGYMDSDWGYESYQGRIKHDIPTVAEVFSEAGYNTIMTGKWHLGTRKGDNPWERGFKEFYGIPKGGGVYFWPTTLDRPVVAYSASEDKGPTVTKPDPESFYSTDAFGDYAVQEINKQKAKEPFFMYVAFIAPHWPQQAREKDIQKYLGKYKEGWNVLRKKRYDRQVKMGIINPAFPLSPPDGLDWEGLSPLEKEPFDRQMATYAAQVDVLDQNVGKIVNALDKKGLKDNTIVIYLSDNGAQRNDESGFERHPGSLFGSKNSMGGYAREWGNLSNTPYRRYKLEEHNGGNATPFIVRWPGKVPKNKINGQVGHIIDVLPTLASAAGITPSGNGAESQNREGMNLLPYFRNPDKSTKSRELYWEHKGNRAVRDGDWKLVAAYGKEWELYNLAEDGTELNDRSAEFPEKVETLKKKYGAWAQRSGVLPWPVKNLNSKK